ncbi:MAG: hypothetical protein ABL951_01250 [Alphaproteobacteria bacterium]
MNILFLAILSIAISVTAQFTLKAGMSAVPVTEAMAGPFSLRTLVTLFTDKYVFGGFVLYGLGAVVWLGVLSKWDVSKAYPLVGLGFAFTAIIGFLAGEQISLQRAGGVALICAGVWVVARS